jgi:hypothetical protein
VALAAFGVALLAASSSCRLITLLLPNIDDVDNVLVWRDALESNSRLLSVVPLPSTLPHFIQRNWAADAACTRAVYCVIWLSTQPEAVQCVSESAVWRMIAQALKATRGDRDWLQCIDIDIGVDDECDM